MEQLKITPLTPDTEPAFYSLVEEYLPDSDPVQLKEYVKLFPKAFLVMLLENEVIGVAFGWHRKLKFPKGNGWICCDV